MLRGSSPNRACIDGVILMCKIHTHTTGDWEKTPVNVQYIDHPVNEILCVLNKLDQSYWALMFHFTVLTFFLILILWLPKR